MHEFYTVNILSYVEKERLPLWVEYVPAGGHLERLFHNHEFSEIVLILHGQAKHLVNKTSADIKTGDVLVVHPGVAHAYDKIDKMELINIVYDQKKLSLPLLDGYSLPLFQIFFPTETLLDEKVMVKPVMALAENDLKETFRMIKRLEDELKNFRPGNSVLSLALFLEIIVLLSRHNANMIEEHRFRFQIGEAIGFMNRNLQRSIDINELVVMTKMSRRDLFRKFKSTTGCSPVEYLLQIRLQRAAEMLLNTNLTVNEIAAECGFYDSNYLCRVFREKMKTSPRQFRLAKRELLKENINENINA